MATTRFRYLFVTTFGVIISVGPLSKICRCQVFEVIISEGPEPFGVSSMQNLSMSESFKNLYVLYIRSTVSLTKVLQVMKLTKE